MVLSADHIIQTDVLFVIEGTAINGAYFQDIKSNYILPSLEYFSQGPVDERDYGSENTSCLYGIVLYYAADCLPCPSSVTYGPYSSASRLLSVIDRLELVGGKGESHANIAEGLATSLQCLEEMGQKHEPGAPSQRHCILVCNSPPYLLPVMESHMYSGKTVEQLSGIFQERGINLSIISPRKIPELFKIFDKAGGSLTSFQTKNYAKDPRHLVLLKGFSLKEHDINPPTGPPSTQTQHAPTSMPTSLPSPMSNTDSSIASVAPQTVQALMNPVPQGPVFRPSQCITGMTIPNQPPMGVQMGRTGPMGNPQFPSQPLVGPPGYHQTPASVAMNTRPPPRWTMIQQQRPPTQYQPPGAQSSALIAQLTQPPSAMAGPGTVNQFGQRMEVPPTSNPQLNQQQNPLRMSLINQPSGGIQTSLPQNMPVQTPGQQQNATNTQQQASNVPAGPGPTQGNAAPGQVGQMREKHIIWQGILEWSEKAKSPNDQQKINRHVPCQVSANSKDGEPELKADSWPQKLIMQLMPKQLIGNIGGTYLKNSKSVLFHPQNCEALESLTKVMSSGFAGCVHFTSVSVPNACDIKVLILLYTAEKRAYLGFIPNDQAAFVDRLRKVIQQQKSSQMMRQGQVAPGTNQINPGGMNAQQNTPAGMTAAAGSPATSQSIGTPQQPGMLMAQANTGMSGPSVPGQQQGPQQGLIGSQTNVPGPRMNLQGIGNVANQSQPGIAGPIRNQVVGQQASGQGPGMLGAPQQQRPPIDHIEVARQQNLEKILHLQQTLEAAQQQEAQYKSQLEIMNHMKTQHIQEALNMAQQQEMQYKQMEQEQQKQLRAQIQQMQQQQQQRGPMAPQVSQAGPVGGVVAPGQQRMMRPNVMSNNPGLRHLLQQQQPQYRQQLMGLQSMGNAGPRGPQINQQMNANQNKQFDDVVSFDFM